MMFHIYMLAALIAVGGAQSPTTYRAIPTLASTVNSAPSLLPNIKNPNAPDSQKVCPGYKATNVNHSKYGLTADLELAGASCNTYGLDINSLHLTVEYQDRKRLNVHILPKHLSSANSSHYFLPKYITGYPEFEKHKGDDLKFEWTNTPTFQFKICRTHSNEVIFSTYGSVIVYQNQFLELVTSMVPNYNAYGLAENIGRFRLGDNFTKTFYAADAGNPIDGNIYGTHPMYLETRYRNGSASLSHGVYIRNAHGQEWLLRKNTLTYRTLGGSLDLYFLSGTTPQKVIQQYQAGIVGKPIMQPYWTFGFHQCRWGYSNWSETEAVVNNYRAANIPLETVWNDIDYMDQYRDFTNSKQAFPLSDGQAFFKRLHDNEQHYVPIIDSNVYRPNPANASDAYGSFIRGEALNAFIRNGPDELYIGDNWPGFSVWADWLVPQGQQYWENEIVNWYKDIQFDGLWLDLSEVSSFCVGSCGKNNLDLNPNHPPFKLPGDPGNIDYNYPEQFNVTNRTEAASAISASMIQASSVSATMSPSAVLPTSTAIVVPTDGSRNLNFPPYVINNIFEGHALIKNSMSPNATHNDAEQSVEYDFHNVWGHMALNATANALRRVFPGLRPFVLGRSTFAGSGTYASHWGGDNTSKWGSMYYSISQALQFAIAGIPMFGADTCGFAGNSDYELCTRWMELSAFFPFMRNHNVFAAISQEAYVWGSTAEATRKVLKIRYALLPYMYTLFHQANTQGLTVMRALSWEFPNDETLAAVETQFLLGPSLLITPVLEPLVTTVRGVFPGVADGVRWYDYHTLQRITAAPRANVTLAAPLDHINVHVRGGSILPMQKPGYTTNESRRGAWTLLAAVDSHGTAKGHLYLDDGVTEVQKATKTIQFKLSKHELCATVSGSYNGQNTPLDSITIAGFSYKPHSIKFNGLKCGETMVSFANSTLKVSGLQSFTTSGAFEKDWVLSLS